MVYFIEGGGFVKIGVAENPEIRLKALQTGCPHDLRLICCIEGGFGLEKKFTKCFQKKSDAVSGLF